MGDMAKCADIFVVLVQAATEDVGLKLSLFQKIDAAAPAHAILASNTSSISITKIAAATKRPEKVSFGAHLFFAFVSVEMCALCCARVIMRVIFSSNVL